MRAAIIYWSKTGNTEKVARAIHEGLAAAGVEVLLRRVEEAEELDFYAYDLVCIGCPSYRWHPPKPVDDFLVRKFGQYTDGFYPHHKQGRVKTGAPKVPGRNVLVFCTYSGPHTGIREAIPVGKYVGQFFEHLGFTVLDEWYVLGEFHGSEERSTKGRMGDIRGRPNEEDLRKIRQNVAHLLRSMDDPELQAIADYRRLSDRIATAGQPTEKQLAAVAKAGFEAVVNLALHDTEHALPDEKGVIESLGMDYAHIPVVWERPTEDDLDRFFHTMDRYRDRSVFVHCVANARVSVFMALYRILRLGWPVKGALRDVYTVWAPNETWQGFIDDMLNRKMDWEQTEI